jgi:hypothetical protein
VKLICFLIEHERPRSVQLAHEARIGEQLRVMVHFSTTDREAHRLTIVCQDAEDNEYSLGSFEGACLFGTRLLALGGFLEPLKTAGWVRIHLLLDGERIDVSRALFVLGPRRSRGRYLGRGDKPGVEQAAAPPQTEASSGPADEPASPESLPLAGRLRAGRRR